MMQKQSYKCQLKYGILYETHKYSVSVTGATSSNLLCALFNIICCNFGKVTDV